ncbi:hypothetical protein E2562_000782 [Oryza meyeriana var. granulata]|uniref:Uncharacterized protein n=1 Tax=Oryza meyeriana var. granulata TaxID=110450 RepID=A0A6G1DUJ4_9ORYZ|nr:hypothetical protein E2562_000782 [Oryza meyeriana var. granulata]
MCSIQYNVPLGFNLGEGRARQLQLILVRNFETLAISATTYMRVRSRKNVETIAKARADAAVLCRSKAAAKAQAKSEASSKALADALGPASTVLRRRRAKAAAKARADAEAAAKAQADAIGPAAAVIRHRRDAEIKKTAESSKRRRGV